MAPERGKSGPITELPSTGAGANSSVSILLLALLSALGLVFGAIGVHRRSR